MLVAGLSALPGILVGAGQLRRGRSIGVSFFGLFFFSALLLSLLQLVPLPAALRALLAPGTDSLLRLVLAPLGGYPAHPHPLSVDPSATLNEAVRLLGYLCLLSSLGAAFSHRGDGLRLLVALVVSAGLLSVLGLAAGLGAGLPPPLGVVGEGVTRARFPAGFLNSNHMAAYVAIGAILLARLIFMAGWQARVPLLLLSALLNVVLIGTLSRTGILLGLLGQLAVVLHGGWQQGLARFRRPLALFVPLLGLCLYLAAANDTRRDLEGRFAALRPRDLGAAGSKVNAWREALPLIRRHLPLGVGRGAFENAFSPHSSVATTVRFTHLENGPLQAACDFGLPGSLILLALLFLGARDVLRRLLREHRAGKRHAHRVAALVALSAVALHNLFDFNLETGGVALAVLGLIHVVELRRFQVPAWALLSLSVLLLPAAALTQAFAQSHLEEGRTLEVLGSDRKVPAEQVLARGARAVSRHPLDAYLPALVAARLHEEHRPETVEWINRSLIANPGEFLALRLSVELLGEHGHDRQARAMLRGLFARASYPQRQQLYRIVDHIVRETSHLGEILPDDPIVIDEMLAFLGSTPAPRWPLVRALGALGQHRGARSATLWLATAALKERDLDAAERLGLRLAEDAQPPAFLIAEIASLLMEGGRSTAAERLCERAQGRVATAEVVLVMAVLAERRGEPQRARALLGEALHLTAEPELRARVHDLVADMEERQGHAHRALLERREAARLRSRR